jgi:hypothetical protein
MIYLRAPGVVGVSLWRFVVCAAWGGPYGLGLAFWFAPPRYRWSAFPGGLAAS